MRGVQVEEHELLLVLHAERAEDDRVDQRENGGVRADAKRERQNRGDGEARTGAQASKRDSQILEKAVHACRLRVRRELVRTNHAILFPGEPFRDDDEIQHPMTLTAGFWLGVYPVTQGQWHRVAGKLPDGEVQ